MKLYHYIKTEDELSKIVKNKNISQTSQSGETSKYVDATGDHYDTPGVVLYPVDLFKIPTDFIARIEYDYTELRSHELLLIDDETSHKVESESDITMRIKDFTHPYNLDMAYHKYGKDYADVPYIIDFTKDLSVDKSRVEYKSECRYLGLPKNVRKIQDFYAWMRVNIRYGYFSKDNKPHSGFEEFFELYRLPSPEEVVKNKLGVCWGQTHLEQAWFNSQGYTNHVFYIELTSLPHRPTHTFLIFEEVKGVMWYFESSWGDRAQLTRITSLKDLVTNTVKAMIAFESEQAGKQVNVPDKSVFVSRVPIIPPYGCTCEEYMGFCESFGNIYDHISKTL